MNVYNKKKIISISLFLVIYEFVFPFIFKDNDFPIYFDKIINNNKKYIFTFWEPKDKMPHFLRLCILTWKKYLHDYEIVILDYQFTKYYLGETLFSKIICKKMSIMVQSDAIRIAILNKFGGIWMDADTIITSKEFLRYFNSSDLAMVMDKNTGFQFWKF